MSTETASDIRASFSRTRFLSAFELARTAAPTRSPRAACTHIKLEANEDGTFLYADDREMGIRVPVAGSVDFHGAALLPPRFGAWLENVAIEDITISSENGSVKASCAVGEVRLDMENVEDFPSRSFDASGGFEIDAQILATALRRTEFATDVESSRYALQGVFFHSAGGKFHLVSSDGRRMAIAELPIVREDCHVIMPQRACRLIIKAIGDDTGTAKVLLSESAIIIETPRATVACNPLEGRFPKWSDVIPKDPPKCVVECNAKELASAVQMVRIVTDEECRGVTFAAGAGKLELSGRTVQYGKSSAVVQATVEGESIETFLDPRYVLDAISLLDRCRIEMRGRKSPSIFVADGWRYIVMPLKDGA
jgi:DNA polymerase-3 subunit beta